MALTSKHLAAKADDDDELGMWEHRYMFFGRRISIREDFNAGLGGTLFDGSLCLARYLEFRHAQSTGDNEVDGKELSATPGFLAGKSVVELGAGCGLPGFLAGLLGAAPCVLTDIEETVELLEENLESNAPHLPDGGARVTTEELDWTEAEHLARFADRAPFDFVLCADTIYETECVRPFLAVLDALSGPDTTIVFAHPNERVKEASELFWTLMPERYVCTKVPPREFGAQAGSFVTARHGVFLLRKRGEGDEGAASWDPSQKPDASWHEAALPELHQPLVDADGNFVGGVADDDDGGGGGDAAAADDSNGPK